MCAPRQDKLDQDTSLSEGTTGNEDVATRRLIGGPVEGPKKETMAQAGHVNMMIGKSEATYYGFSKHTFDP